MHTHIIVGKLNKHQTVCTGGLRVLRITTIWRWILLFFLQSTYICKNAKQKTYEGSGGKNGLRKTSHTCCLFSASLQDLGHTSYLQRPCQALRSSMAMLLTYCSNIDFRYTSSGIPSRFCHL